MSNSEKWKRQTLIDDALRAHHRQLAITQAVHVGIALAIVAGIVWAVFA